MYWVDAIEIDESFGDFKDTAADVKAEVYEELSRMHAAAVAREAESKRLAEERAELDRQRAEQAERERVCRVSARDWRQRTRTSERAAFEAEQAEAREKERVRQAAIDAENARSSC
jgi:hypothetical protein